MDYIFFDFLKYIIYSIPKDLRNLNISKDTMADKFLNTGGSGQVNISNGTVDIFAATISSANLLPSKAIKTNSVKELVSSNLDIADVNNLQQELDNVISNPFPGTLKVGDLETDNYFSVNDELQKIDNLTASTTAPDTTNITGLLNVDEIATGRIFDEAQQTFIELDGTDVAVSATNLTLNGNSVLTTISTEITDLETKTQNIQLATTGQTDITGTIKTDRIIMEDNNGIVFLADVSNSTGLKVRDGIKSINTADNAFMKISSSSNLFNFTWNSTDQPQNDGDFISFKQNDGLDDGRLTIRSPNITNGELVLQGANMTIDSDFLIVDTSINTTDFAKYQGGVDYLNPPGINSLAAVGYVNQEVSNIDYSNVVVNTSFNEDMTALKPIGTLSPNVVYNQGIAIEIPVEGGAVDYPAYNISNGGVLEFTFSFPSGFSGLVQGIGLGDSSSLANNSYIIRYSPSIALNQLTVLANINGSSTLPFQATTPAGITAWRITYTTSNLQIEGKVGAGAYVSYINGAITPAVLDAGIAISSSGAGPNRAMNILNVIFSGSDSLATKGDATASFDKLSTYRKRYDIDDAPVVFLQENKPITYKGVGAYTFEIAKDQLGFNAPLRGNAPVEVNVSTDYYNRKWDAKSGDTTQILSLEDTKIGFNQNTGFVRYWGYPIFEFNSIASFKFKTTGTATAGDLYVGITDNPTNPDGLVGFSGQSVSGFIYNNGVIVAGGNSAWATGDECEFRIISGTWQIYKNGLPTFGTTFSLVNNGKPYYFCIINNQGGGNLVEMEITEVITNYVATPTKQMSVEGSIDAKTVKLRDDAVPTARANGGGYVYKKINDYRLYWLPDLTGREIDLTQGSSTTILDWTSPDAPTSSGITLNNGSSFANINNNYFIRVVDGGNQIRSVNFNAGNIPNFRFEVSFKILNTNNPADILGFYANATNSNPTSENNTGGLIYYTDYYNANTHIYRSSLINGPNVIFSNKITGFDTVSGTYHKFSMTRIYNEIEIIHESDVIGRVRDFNISSISTAGANFGIYGRTSGESISVEVRSIKISALS